MRRRGNASAADLARAEERLATVQRQADTASANRVSAVNDLTQARARANNAADEGERSTRRFSGSLDGFGSAADGAAGKLAGLATAAVGVGSAMALGMSAIENEAITNKLAASLGATGDLAAEYGEKAGNLYKNNFGESMEEASAAIGMVATSFKTAGFEGEASMEKIAENALNFASIFDQDVSSSIQTASQLVTNGLAKDSTEAFDLLTTAFQTVPAAMREELPEILQEYGTNFRALGFDGQESFNVLVAAAEQGKFALDKTGDALKEFTLLGSDMSKSSTEAYQAIGLNAEEMSRKVAMGGEPAQQALQAVANGLLGMEDPLTRANTAIALFGTPLEDLSVDQIPAFLEGLTGGENAMANFAGSAEQAGATLNSGTGAAFETLKRQITGGLTDALGTAAKFMMDNKDAIVSLSIAVAPLAGTLLGIAAAMKAWAIAQLALNVAMNANPIMLIVTAVGALVAGVIYAYRESETFRNIVQGAWEGIKTAVSAAWTGFIQPVVNALVTGFQWIGDKASWLWTTVIQPVFGFIGNAAQVLMAVVGTVLITPFILAWNSIGAIVQTVWNTVLSPLWELMKAGLGLLGDAFSFYWNNVVKPVWDAFGAGIQWVWANVVSPVWDALKSGLGLVQDAFSWAWNNVIKPVWDALGAGIKFVWDNVISPVWEALKTGLDTLKSSFDTAVGFIGQVWDRIKGIVAAPVRFVVETVYNNGIREAWNKVSGFLGLGNLEPVDLGMLGAYATGGIIPGYTPGRDTGLIAVGGGEAVMRPEFTRAVGEDYINSANAAARNGGVQGVKRWMGAYADGGIVQGGAELTTDVQRSMWDAVRTAFPNAVLTSGTRYADVGSGYDFHMAGQAIDLGGPMQQIADWIASTYPNALELFWDPGPNLDEGRPTGAIGGHSDHVHWAMSQIVDSAGKLISADAGSSGSGGGPGVLRRMIAGLFDGVMDPIGRMIPSFGDSDIGRLPKLAFDKFQSSVREWILGEADKKGGSSGGSWDVAPGTGPVADQVREAFAAYGWGDGPQWDAASWIIGKESSWNPTARNPESGAFGLFQFLGGTKEQYLPDENPNPKIQGDAGARYMRDRYGDPLGAKAFWEQNGWYDQGGLAQGAGIMLKKVIQPERVLSPEMTQHFERLVDVLEKPDFINALKQAAPAQSDPAAASSIPAPQPIPSISSTSPATSSSSPIGGTGVDEQYTQEDKWGEWQKNASDRFAKAGQAFFEGQLEGMPFGNHLRAMRDRGSQINVIVQDMYEAIEKLRQEERRRTMASGSRF